MKTRWQDLSRDVLGTFDLVNCQGILYHEPDPMQLLLALQRLLAPGGKLVLETHITMEDDMNARFIEGNFWGDPNWWWLPSSDTMMAMLRTCGFEDVQLRAKYPVPSQNPNNEHLTVEGVPVGGRAFFTATQPQNPAASRKVRFSLGGRDR
jgi:SAM-dependent methyltransferase